MLRGTGASAGIGIGYAVMLRQDEITIGKRMVSNLAAEQQRFFKAVGIFCTEILTAYHVAREKIGESEASIITAQITIITDPELHKEVIEVMWRDGVSAEYAFCQICDKYISLFSKMEDELMQSRSADFRDIKIRLLSILLDIQRQHLDLNHVPLGSILVAEDIPPSRAATLDPERVCAIVTQNGNRHSHIAIIARSLKVPVVVGVYGLLETIHEGDKLIVDGNGGQILRNPSSSIVKHYVAMQSVRQHVVQKKVPQHSYNAVSS